MGQLIIALMAGAYYLLGPLVLAIGVTGAVVLAILSGAGSLALQIGSGIIAGRATGSRRPLTRGLGWVGLLIGAAMSAVTAVVAVCLALAVLAVTSVTAGAFELPV